MEQQLAVLEHTDLQPSSVPVEPTRLTEASPERRSTPAAHVHVPPVQPVFTRGTVGVAEGEVVGETEGEVVGETEGEGFTYENHPELQTNVVLAVFRKISQFAPLLQVAIVPEKVKPTQVEVASHAAFAEAMVCLDDDISLPALK